MHTNFTVTERSRVTCNPDTPKSVVVVEVYRADFACQEHTLTVTFTDAGQVEDLIASCTALLFDFLTEAEVEALR